MEVLVGSPDTLIEYVTPERTLAPDVGSMNSPAYIRTFTAHGVLTTLAQRLRSVRRTRTDGSPRPCTASTPTPKPSGSRTT
ncbi:hypothetical protein NKH77_53040 [Streptomyces sp. M19]